MAWTNASSGVMASSLGPGSPQCTASAPSPPGSGGPSRVAAPPGNMAWMEPRLAGARCCVRESVHDNWLYAQAVDHERCRVVLHTVWPHGEPPEYTDVVFEGVAVHHFEQQMVGGGPSPANVLFDVEEADPLFILGQYEGLLSRTKNYGWPVSNYDGLGDLAAQLTAGGARCFEVHGVGGL